MNEFSTIIQPASDIFPEEEYNLELDSSAAERIEKANGFANALVPGIDGGRAPAPVRHPHQEGVL